MASNTSLHYFFYSICFLFIYYKLKQADCVKITETCYSTCISLLFVDFDCFHCPHL